MQAADYIVMAVYVVLVLGLGACFSRRQRSQGEFFLAGRSLSWLPLGLSVMASLFSAVNYTAFPTEIMGHGLYVILTLPMFVVVALPITRVAMPFLRGMQLCSAHEYLERRFDLRVRCVAGVLFVLWRLFWMATTLYAASVLMRRLVGASSMYPFLLVVGVTAVIYTTMGGMRAVVWTDVMQVVVLVGGIAAAVSAAFWRTPGGVAGALRACAGGGLLKPFYPFDPAMFSISPTVRISLWSAWIGAFTAFLARYGADQMVLQRYFAAKSLQGARRAFRINYIAALVAVSGLGLMGLSIYAVVCAGGSAQNLSPLACLALFIKGLPAGVRGLLAAGILAAAMSSMDSGIHACATVIVTDFCDRLHGGVNDRLGEGQRSTGRGVRVGFARVLTAVLGVGVMAIACYVGRLGTLFEIANKIVNGLGSPLLAMFLLGMFFPRANSWGIVVGGILGAVWSAWVSFAVKGLALHYYAVVNLLGTMALCLGASAIAGMLKAGATPDQLKWTWAARRRLPEP